VSANCVGVYCLAEVGHLFKSLDFLGSYSNIGWFYIVADVGHPSYGTIVALTGYMYFPHRSPVIRFRLAENLALDYSDFRDEGLRVAIFARSGGGKSNLAALFAEQALEQGLQTLVIEPLREYITPNKLYDVVG